MRCLLKNIEPFTPIYCCKENTGFLFPQLYPLLLENHSGSVRYTKCCHKMDSEHDLIDTAYMLSPIARLKGEKKATTEKKESLYFYF